MVCPVCSSDSSQFYLRVKDFTVSTNYFELNRCSECAFIFTKDPPGKDAIGKYYKSNEYISHTDSSKGWMNKVYQLVRNFTILQKIQLLKKYTGLQSGNLANDSLVVVNGDGTLKKVNAESLLQSGSQSFTATAGQSTFNVTNMPASASKVYVWRNGAKLVVTADYTTAAGTVTLKTAIASLVEAGDEIEVQWVK